jgi:hypothetical protein
MADKLSETQLEAIIANQIELAKSHDKAERQTSRDKALDYYFGRMDAYVPPEENRSKVVSRDVADTLGWIMPQLMRVWTASGRMFVAEPVEVEDLDYADAVSDGMNYVFWKDNDGYQTVYDATWDALLHGDGIVKTFFDETPVYGPAQFEEGLTEDLLALALQDDRVEVLAKTKHDDETYDLKYRVKKAEGKFVVIAIPPEDFLIDGDATSLEEAAFKDHWQRVTRSSLVAMGYDKDTVWAIPEAARNETAEAQARRLFVNAEATDKSMELVEYHECFVMVDVDGDGEAELVRVCFGGPGGTTGGSILDWEVWEDEDPFDNIPCEPIPHRWDSRSVADEEIDIQDVKTVLMRQLLNNTYWVNNPQRFAQGKIKNPEALDNPVFGQTVFGDTGATVTDLTVPYIGDKALLGIHHMDEVSARRTGVNSQSMALDPEVLQNQSATANQNATDASRSQPELIARNMAEMGWSKVGRKILRLMHKHPMERQILVKGKPLQIDPKTWNPDMHVNVNTGLGTGSRDKDAMMLGQVLQQQILFTDRIGVAFPEKALDMLPYIHNTLTRFAESTGLKNPELYWPDIDEAEIEAGKQALAERAKQPPESVQLEQMKQQGAEKLKQVDAQVSQQTAQLKAEGDIVKNQAELEADLQTKEADRQNALLLAAAQHEADLQKLDKEIAFKMWEKEQTFALEREKMANAQTIAAMKPQPEPAGKAN